MNDQPPARQLRIVSPDTASGKGPLSQDYQ